MVDVTDLFSGASKLLPGQDTGRAVLRGAKVGASILATASEPEPIFKIHDLAGGRGLDAATSLRQQILVDNTVDKSPGLFVEIGGVWTPFMQLGTKLGVGNGMARFLMDVVFDPINLVTPGAGGLVGKVVQGLTKGKLGVSAAERMARITTALLDGAKTHTPEIVMKNLYKTLDAAGRIAGSGRAAELVQLAKTDHKAFSALADTVLKTGRLDKGTEVMIQALKTDSKALKTLLKNSKSFRKNEKLGAEFLTQTSLRNKREVGHVPQFLKVAKPDFSNPVNLLKQMVGIGYRGETHWIPFSRGTAKDLVGGLGRLKPGSLPGRYEVRAPVTGDVNVEDAEWWGSILEAIVGVPSERTAAKLGAAGSVVTEKGYNAAAKGLPGKFKRKYEDVRDSLYNFMGEKLHRTDSAVLAARSEKLARIEAEVITRSHSAALGVTPGTPINPALIDDAMRETAEQQVSLLRAFVADFGLTSLARSAGTDAAGIFRSLANRTAAYSTLARNAVTTYRHVLRAQRPGALNQIDEVLRFVFEKPDAWVRKTIGGEERLVLKAGAIPRKERFGDVLLRNEGLESELVERGLTLTEQRLANSLGNLMGSIGEHLLDAGFTRDLIENYWTRSIIKVKKKFYNRAGAGKVADAQQYMEEILSGEISDDLVTVLMNDELAAESKRFRSKMKTGKASITEMRTLTEKQLAFLEKEGFIEVERGSLNSVANFIEQSGRVVSAQRMVLETPRMAGRMTLQSMPDKMAKGLTEKNLTSVVNSQAPADLRHGLLNAYSDGPIAGATGAPPEKYEHLFKPLTFSKKALPESEDVAVILADAVAEIAKRDAKRIARGEATAARLSGKSVREVRRAVAVSHSGKKSLMIVGKDGKKHKIPFMVKGENVPFDPDWIDDAGNLTVRFDNSHVDIERRLRKEFAATGEIVRKKRVVAIDAAKGVGKADRVLAGKASREAREAAVAKGKEGGNFTIWIRRDLAGQMQEPLRAWQKSGMNGDWMRKFDQLNYALKSTVLLGDIFHYNSLSINQLANAPTRFYSLLLDPQGKLLPGVLEGAYPKGSAAAAATEELLKESIFKGLRQRAAMKAGAGAVAGGAIGASVSEDPFEIGTFSAVGAMWGATLGAAKLNAAFAHRVSMMPQHTDLMRWFARGGATGRPDDRSIGFVYRFLDDTQVKLQRNPDFQNSILAHAVDGTKNVINTWERELWEGLHNGSKFYAFSVNWAQELPKLQRSVKWTGAGAEATRLNKAGELLPDGAAWTADAVQEGLMDDLAQQLVKLGDNHFGGQRFSEIFDDPQFKFMANRFFLSRDWTVSRLQMASNFFMGMPGAGNPVTNAAWGAVVGQTMESVEAGFDPELMHGRGAVFGGGLGFALGQFAQNVNRRMRTKGDVLARRSRNAFSSVLLGGFVMANMLNRMWTGNWMWENEEGKRMSIALPGKSSDGRSRYLSMGKQWLEAFEFAGISEKEGFALPVAGRTASKLSIPLRGGLAIITNRNFFGPITTAKDSPMDLGYALTGLIVDSTTPIIFQGPLRVAGRALSGTEIGAGDIAEAAIRFGGIPVSRGPRGLQRGSLEATLGSLVPPADIGRSAQQSSFFR